MRPLIVALDVETDREALDLVKRLSPQVDLFKIGPVLFLKYGGPLIEQIRKTGANVFLDLKFHDIPSVVKKAIERAAEWGVYSATVHATGGSEMLRQSASVVKRPRLWAVTVLTSLDQSDLKTLGVQRTLEEQVPHLAKLAAESGVDGVVCSVREAKTIKAACGAKFQVVTPGIRLAAGGDDQKRTETPAVAQAAGADFFVMGRPILGAKDPLEAVQEIYKSLINRHPGGS
jgi:orotidine-5'-phosphate decarboxylase